MSAGGGSEILVGGQAVMEGVMMKMPRAFAVTVRRSSGELACLSGDVAPWSDRWPVLKLPLVRGVAVLGQMLGLGMRSLFFSAAFLSVVISAGIVFSLAGGAFDFLRKVNLSTLWSAGWFPRNNLFDVKTILVKLDGKRFAKPGKAKFTLSIDVRKLKAGPHKLIIKASDKFKNGSVSITDFVRCA